VMLNGSKRTPKHSPNILEELFEKFKRLSLFTPDTSDASQLSTSDTLLRSSTVASEDFSSHSSADPSTISAEITSKFYSDDSTDTSKLSSPFECPELRLHILNSVPAEEENYLPLRLVCRQWRQDTDERVYLQLLNTPAVLEETKQKVVSGADKDVLYQRQQDEINFFVQHQVAIRSDYGCAHTHRALANVIMLSRCPITAFHLYQCHKALNMLNMRMIQTKIDLKKQTLICNEVFLTRFPVALLRDPVYLSFFDKLKTLNISNNSLRSLSSFIFQLPCIERVLVSHNEIERVDFNKPPAKTLLWVDLHANRLKAFPQEFLGSEKLSYLNLGHNYLLEVPEILWGKKFTIDLSHNCLTNIDARCPDRKKVLATQKTLEQALADTKKTTKRRCSL